MFILLVLAAAGLLLTRPVSVSESELPAYTADAAAGEKWFHAGGCASCHGKDLSGGEELPAKVGPVEAVFRAPNITPDAETGIGGWSDAEFVSAMKYGTAPDGSHYYPAFPYTSYTRMKTEHLLDLKAYLDSIPAVNREVQASKLGFPFNIRRGLGLWKRLYLDDAWVIDAADAAHAEDEQWLLGRYLVEGAGHCGECHTPRGALGGLKNQAWLNGAPNPEGKGRVPDITPSGKSVKGWSASDFSYYLESGFTPDFDMVGGSMVAVQENMALLDEADRAAIANYLASLPESGGE